MKETTARTPTDTRAEHPLEGKDQRLSTFTHVKVNTVLNTQEGVCMEATQNLHWELKGKASRKGREGNKVKWTLALRYHETGGDRGLYLANLYRGGRGDPVAFLSGPTTSAASHHHRPSSPVSCLLQTSRRGHSCPGFPTWKPLGLLLPREPPSSPLPPRLGPRPTLCLSILTVPPHPRATSSRKP